MKRHNSSPLLRINPCVVLCLFITQMNLGVNEITLLLIPSYSNTSIYRGAYSKAIKRNCLKSFRIKFFSIVKNYITNNITSTYISLYIYNFSLLHQNRFFSSVFLPPPITDLSLQRLPLYFHHEILFSIPILSVFVLVLYE